MYTSNNACRLRDHTLSLFGLAAQLLTDKIRRSKGGVLVNKYCVDVALDKPVVS